MSGVDKRQLAKRLRQAAESVGKYNKDYAPPPTTKKQKNHLALQARHITPLVLERLTQIVLSGADRDAIAAAKELLDRGYGKAQQKIDFTHGLDREQLFQVAEAIIQRRRQEGRELPPKKVETLTMSDPTYKIAEYVPDKDEQ